MKKRGFTLIELLAVIVVLAIIALIATPIVMNVIKNAQMGAAERSADNYVKAVDLLISTNKLDGNSIADGSYTITSTGKLTIDGKDYEVEVSGTKPNGGTIVVKDGQVVKDSSTVNYKDYTVTFENGVAKAEGGEGKKLMTLADCDYVSGTKAEGEVGAKYTCDFGAGNRAFYVLEVGNNPVPDSMLETNEVALILEENYDNEKLAWCDQNGSNPSNKVCNADGLTEKLNSIATNWSKLNRNQVQLPSYTQVYGVNNNGNSLESWLFDNLDSNSSTEIADAYWTSTATSDSDPEVAAYGVNTYGSLGWEMVNDTTRAGVRPVITLSIN